MAVLFQDTFTGTNGTDIVTHNPQWAYEEGTGYISSNRATSDANNQVYLSDNSLWANDMTLTMDVNVNPSSIMIGLFVFYWGAGFTNYVQAGAYTTNWKIETSLGGLTQTASSSGAHALKVVVDSSGNFTLSVDGTQLLTLNEPTATNFAKVGYFINPDNTTWVDNFTINSAGSSNTSSMLMMFS